MIKITLATSNLNKLKEINAINKNENIIFETIKGDFLPIENGNTFEENAVIKAKAAAKITKTYCLADDSGLCVDSLEGRPGIHSSRYAPTQQERIQKLLNELNGLPFDDRSANFTCTMALTNPNGDVIHIETGKVFGYINDKIEGSNGFGYDPIFLLTEFNKTMAQLDETTKNKISHRANALNPMILWIEKNLLYIK